MESFCDQNQIEFMWPHYNLYSEKQPEHTKVAYRLELCYFKENVSYYNTHRGLSAITRTWSNVIFV